MAYMLKSRQMQIPGGFKFIQPETGWKARPFQSFSMLVQALITHRNGNPFLRDKHKWATDQASVEREVEVFNVRVCLAQGWTQYLSGSSGGGPAPKSQALSEHERKSLGAAAGRATKIWSGVKTLNEWIDSDEPPVPVELAESRAAVCLACPLNQTGDFTEWFTRPAAAAIQRQIEKLAHRKLATSQDAKLNVCEACLCPMKLKVHTPIKYITAHLVAGVRDELGRGLNCWILSELA